MAKSKLTLPVGTKVPNHVVIIPDGDRRWARSQGLSASEGHRAGIENLANLAKTCRDWGIHTVSSWGLSTENWKERSKEEVDFIMHGIVAAIDRYMPDLHEQQVKFVHIGRKDRLPQFLLDKLAEAERSTAHYERHVFNVALDYNGWDEITRATQKIVASGVGAEDIDRKLVEQNMDTANQPYPYIDLYIRTGGEQRTSGFMMWQADYAEFYWEAEHFPAFGPEKLREAVLDYSRRRRRFGGNDAEEHLRFNPKLVAGLELKWRHALQHRDDERLRDLLVTYVKEHYGLSKELAKEAGKALLKAVISGRDEKWQEAEAAFNKLYEVIKGALGFTFEPDMVANIEVQLSKNGGTEEDLKSLIAEKFRFSKFQAAKSAHLAHLANVEMAKNNWDKAKGYMEKFYVALKDRVA